MYVTQFLTFLIDSPPPMGSDIWNPLLMEGGWDSDTTSHRSTTVLLSTSRADTRRVAEPGERVRSVTGNSVSDPALRRNGVGVSI